MSAVLENDEHLEIVTNQLLRWGFAGQVSEQLKIHASNVIQYSNLQIGRVIVALNLASQQEIEDLVAVKPNDQRTLEWLCSNLDQVQRRQDEILAISQRIPFISQNHNALALHPLLQDPDVGDQLIHALEQLNATLVKSGTNTILMFTDNEKLNRYRTMGRVDRMNDVIHGILSRNGEKSAPYVAMMSNSVALHYRSQIGGRDAGIKSSDDALQTISYTEVDGNSLIRQVVQVLTKAVEDGVNDVSIEPNAREGRAKVLFRKNQRLRDTGIELTGDNKNEFISLLMSRSGGNKLSARLKAPADGSCLFEGKTGQAFMRLSFIPLEGSSGDAISTSVRILPRSAKQIEMDSLNIRPQIQKELKRLLKRGHGLVVVCGPTGSGKSTTIASMLCEHYNVYGQSKKRMSVEEPVERILPGVKHIDVNEHSYNDPEVNKFALALRAILRHDPDLLFVGEVRDAETCTVSVDSANTGHLVFTTTHANDPVLGYRRLASFLPENRQFDLVTVLEAILAQRLVTTLCQHCSTIESVTQEDIDDLEQYCLIKGINLEALEIPQSHRVINPSGCQHCLEGVSGQVPVHGLLLMNPDVRRLLLSKDERDWMKAQSAGQAGTSLFEHAFDLYRSGLISFETVML